MCVCVRSFVCIRCVSVHTPYNSMDACVFMRALKFLRACEVYYSPTPSRHNDHPLPHSHTTIHTILSLSPSHITTLQPTLPLYHTHYHTTTQTTTPTIKLPTHQSSYQAKTIPTLPPHSTKAYQHHDLVPGRTKIHSFLHWRDFTYSLFCISRIFRQFNEVQD